VNHPQSAVLTETILLLGMVLHQEGPQHQVNAIRQVRVGVSSTLHRAVHHLLYLLGVINPALPELLPAVILGDLLLLPGLVLLSAAGVLHQEASLPLVEAEARLVQVLAGLPHPDLLRAKKLK